MSNPLAQSTETQPRHDHLDDLDGVLDPASPYLVAMQNAREVGASNAVVRMLIGGLADLKSEGNYRRFTIHDLYDLAVELQDRLHRIKV